MGRRPDPTTYIPPEVGMFGNRFARQWQQSATNLRTYASWWQLFYTAATTCFEWEGLPPEIDTRYLEQVLFCRGTAALTRYSSGKTPAGLYLVAPYSNVGMLDVYNNPNTVQLYTPNGLTFRRHNNVWVKNTANQYARRAEVMHRDAVVCWDSLTRLPLWRQIDLLCRRLAEIDMTIDQNVRSQRVPYLITVPEEGKRNAEDFFNRIDTGQPAIYMTPAATGVMQVQVFQSGIDYVVDKMLNDELKLVSQGYTLLGIDNNAAAEKKERVQTAETLANNEQFLIQRRSRLSARADRFCDEVRRTFGLEVSCRWAIPHFTDGDNDTYSDSPSLQPYQTQVNDGLVFSGNSNGGSEDAGL